MVNIPEQHEAIKQLNDNDKNAHNNFIQENVAIKIEKMQDDDTRKVVEDEAKTKEPEQSSEQSSGAIRKSSRERVPTKRYEDYELHMTVAEEEEFLLATNGEEYDDENNGGISNEGNHAEMDNETLSAVAHYIMVHCTEKECSRSGKGNTSQKLSNTCWTLGLRSLGAEAKQLSQRSSINSILMKCLNRWRQVPLMRNHC